jgi:hypothetical protein
MHLDPMQLLALAALVEASHEGSLVFLPSVGGGSNLPPKRLLTTFQRGDQWLR